MSTDEFLVRVIKPWLAKEPTRPEAELTSEEVMKALDAITWPDFDQKLKDRFPNGVQPLETPFWKKLRA